MTLISPFTAALTFALSKLNKANHVIRAIQAICLICAASFLPAANAQTLNQSTGIFWNQSESGWGCNSVAQVNSANPLGTTPNVSKFILFITCFVYDKDGKPVWLVAPDARDVGVGLSNTGRNVNYVNYVSRLYRTTSAGFGTTFNPNAVGVFDVGTIEFDMTRVFDKTITFTLNDATNVVQFNAMPNSQGQRIVTKRVIRQQWGLLPATVEYAQEKIIPQGVQVKIPEAILPVTLTRNDSPEFMQAILDGRVLLVDSGVKYLDDPIIANRSRDIVYAVFKTKVSIANDGTTRYVMKPLWRDSLKSVFGAENDDVINARALSTDQGGDRYLGTSNGMLFRQESTSACALSTYDRGLFSSFISQACPVWN